MLLFSCANKNFISWRLSNDCQIARPTLVSGPPNRKKPYNKHLISLVFLGRTVNYGSSFFSRLGHKSMGKKLGRNLQYGPKTRLIRGTYGRHYLTFVDCPKTKISCSSYFWLSVGNCAYSVIPENIVHKKTTEKSRSEIIQALLSNDPRNTHEQVWNLEKQKKERRQVPRCQTCRKIQIEDEVTSTDKGLYVPYEKNFVTETIFYFCPRKQCINNFPHWTNLKPPDRIRADSLFTDDTVAALKDNGLPICTCNSVDLSN